MTGNNPLSRSKVYRHRALAAWLFSLCIMIFVMALVGAITRLTESGLSIMEWAPVKGILPPFLDQEWKRLFLLYQQTDEFRIDNQQMSLSGFKTIFWWEWLHRNLGRFLGLVLIAGLVWFWARKQLPAWLKPHLLFVLVLGGLQGAVGWLMVASGFNDGLTDVSHFRLAVHLGLALFLYAYLLLLTLKLIWPSLRGGESEDVCRPAAGSQLPGLSVYRLIKPGLRVALLWLVIVIISGALVAGLNGGMIYNDWPLMGTQWFPPDYIHPDLGTYNSLFSHATAVQFNHRWLATGLLLFIFFMVFMAFYARDRLSRRELCFFALLAFVAVCQVLLGIVTLLMSVPVVLGVAHQAGAIILLTVCIVTLYAHEVRRAPVLE